jgi:hypothetical protein
MPADSRLNLSSLRNLDHQRIGADPITWLREVKFSRRRFIGLSAVAGAAAAVPLVGGEGFSVLQQNQSIYVLSGGKIRWEIGAERFGTRASVGLKRERDRIHLWLSDAVFPGTDLPADFDADFLKSSGSWLLKMVMKCGLNFEADLLTWLDGNSPGTGSLVPPTLGPIRGAKVKQLSHAVVNFSPTWDFVVRGLGEVVLDRLPHGLPFTRWAISLQPDVQLAGGAPGERTLFSFHRSDRDWHVPLGREATEGWSLQHERGLFDELHLEGVSRNGERLSTALLCSAERSSGCLYLHPGGGLLSDSAEPFRMKLERPRMAFGLENGRADSALIADISSEPVWAHAPEISVLLAGGGEHPHFELVESQQPSSATAQPAVAPQVLCAEIPCGNDSKMSVVFNGKHPLHFNWATGIQWFERILGGLDMTPWESHLAFDLTCDHEVRLLRPRDQFQLRFRFENMRLSAGFGSNVRRRKHIPPATEPNPAPSTGKKVHCAPIPGRVARVTVVFPPQHLAERAFFESLKHPPKQTKNVLGDAELHDGITPADLDPDDTNIKSEDRYVPVESRLAGDSQLVFELPEDVESIPFDFKGLLNWEKWKPVIARTARTDASKSRPTLQNADPTDPKTEAYATAIEIPYRVFVSPTDRGGWKHSVEAVDHKTAYTELWHTRLGVLNKGSIDERDAANRIGSAIWSPDFSGYLLPEHENVFPFRTSMDRRDRAEVVHLTSNYNIQPFSDGPPFDPSPLRLDRLMLTPMGGYLRSLGAWNPPRLIPKPKTPKDFLTVEQWRQDAVLLRDQYVRVVYKGYALPFGHRTSVVKVTERVIREVTLPESGRKLCAAFLHQYKYLTFQHPRRDYPLLGQNFNGRGFGFRRVDILTPSTPPIDEPDDQSLFWPKVGGTPFPIQFKFWDADGKPSFASVYILFVGAGVAQVEAYAQDAVDTYNDGIPDYDDSLVSDLGTQQIAFAPSTKPGDTTYYTKSITWRADLSSADIDSLYRNDLPCFAPEIASADISSSTLNRISGKSPNDPSSRTTVSFYPNYLQSGFDPKANRGEVVLQVQANPLSLQFGAAGNVDKSGGLASPDSLVVGFSRNSGPVGGRSADVGAKESVTTTSSLDVHASGNFDPAAFFGGLTSAKILGAVKLSDVIGAFAQGIGSDLKKIPTMLETALGAVDQTAFDAEATVINQVFEPIQRLVESVRALAGPMANPASSVRSAWTAVQGAHATTAKANSSDKLFTEAAEARAHAELIGDLVKYEATLEKLLQDPLGLAEQAVLDALSDVIGQQLVPFEQALSGAFETLVASLVRDAASQLKHVITVLDGVAKEIASSVADPFPDIDTVVKSVLLSELVPDLVTCLEAETIVEDLSSRVKALNASGNRSPELRLIQVLGSLGPIAQDILQLEDKLGLLGLITAQKNAADVVSKAVFDAAKKLQVTIIEEFHKIVSAVIQNQTAVSNSLEQLSNACLILAAVPEFGDSGSVLQNLRQLERSVGKLERATAELASLVNSTGEAQRKIVWRCSMLQRQLVRQVLEAALALRIAAEAAVSSDKLERHQPAQAVLAGCKAVTDVLNLASQLKAKRRDCLTAILNDPALTNTKFGTSGVLGVATEFSRLDILLDNLETQIAGAGANFTGELSLSLRYIGSWLQYQSPIAAVYGWDLYEGGYSSLRALSELSAYAGWAGDRAKEFKASCLQVKAQASTIRAAVDNIVENNGSPLTGAIVSAGALQSIVQTMDNSFRSFVPGQEPAIATTLQTVERGLAAASEFLATLQQGISDLKNDVAEVEQIIAQLPELVRRIPEAIKIELSFDWHPKIRSFEPVFRLEDGADLVVKASSVVSLARIASPSYDISATLTNFSINLIGAPSFIIVGIKSLQFTSVSGSKPDCKLQISKVTFGSAMAFVQKLAQLLDPGDGPFLEFADGMVNAGYRFQVPTIVVGAFTLMQLSLDVSIGLPFNGDPVRCYFGISSAHRPFLLSAGIYGGTGYLLMRLGLDGVERLEGSFAFGIVAVVNIGPLKGYGAVVAGVHFAIGSGLSEVCGFVQAHGHCDIFGIISLDINVHVDVCYRNGSVEGHAEFTVDIEMLFFSVSYSFTASYSFAGSGPNQAALRHSNSLEVASLAMPPLRFPETTDSLPFPAPSDQTTGSVIKGNRIDENAWRAYFNSFDAFPDEVAA